MKETLEKNVIEEVIKNLVSQTGYADFRLTKKFADLVVLNPKTSTSGTMDFISLNSEFLQHFRSTGPCVVDHKFSILNSEITQGIDAIGMDIIPPKLGLLLGQEKSITFEDEDMPVGVCSVINSIKQLGDFNPNDFSPNIEGLSFFDGFKTALNNLEVAIGEALDTIHVSGHPVLTPDGMVDISIDAKSTVMGIYYTADSSIMCLNPPVFIDNVSKILDRLTRMLMATDSTPETFIIVEVLPGCIINIATAVFNMCTQKYIIDVVTPYSIIQLPDHLQLESGTVTTGGMSIESYRSELSTLLDNVIKDIADKNAPKIQEYTESNGVIHFPKSKHLS